jgi:hypothetical protein
LSYIDSNTVKFTETISYEYKDSLLSSYKYDDKINLAKYFYTNVSSSQFKELNEAHEIVLFEDPRVDSVDMYVNGIPEQDLYYLNVDFNCIFSCENKCKRWFNGVNVLCSDNPNYFPLYRKGVYEEIIKYCEE